MEHTVAYVRQLRKIANQIDKNWLEISKAHREHNIERVYDVAFRLKVLQATEKQLQHYLNKPYLE